MKDDNEFIKLYNNTYKILLKYVVIKCDNIFNVEDIIQNVYMKVYKLLPRKGINYFSIPILIKLCKNELFRYYNYKNKFKVLLYNDKIDYNIEDIKSTSNIENDLEVRLSLEDAFNIIKKEDILVQKIATLYFLNDMTIKDISKVLNMNINTVKSKLYRLISKLKSVGDIYD